MLRQMIVRMNLHRKILRCIDVLEKKRQPGSVGAPMRGPQNLLGELLDQIVERRPCRWSGGDDGMEPIFNLTDVGDFPALSYRGLQFQVGT